MQYMLLIYTPPDAYGDYSEEEWAALVRRYEAYMAEQKEAGRYVDALRLDHREEARTVRIAREGGAAATGGATATDGPFVETKEMLAGYFLLECASRDEAVEQAKKIPGAEVGTVEVRGVIDLRALFANA